MGTLSVWPSTRMGASGSEAASAESMVSAAVRLEDAERREGGLHGLGDLALLLFVGLAGSEEDDEEGEEQRDEIGVRDEPALVVDMLVFLLAAHAAASAAGWPDLSSSRKVRS